MLECRHARHHHRLHNDTHAKMRGCSRLKRARRIWAGQLNPHLQVRLSCGSEALHAACLGPFNLEYRHHKRWRRHWRQGPDSTDHNRTEPTRPEQNITDQTRTEQHRTEQHNAEQNRTEQSRTKQNGTEQRNSKTEQNRTET